MSWESAIARFNRAKGYGFHFQFANNSQYYTKKSLEFRSYYIKNPAYKPPYKAKFGSHDDGPLNGPLLGGIGTSNFSRDFAGLFNRWHLQQGVHQHEVIEPAFFMLRWKMDEKIHYKRLRIGTGDFQESQMEYACLFPFVYEYYNSEELPFELLMEYYSPTIPHNYQDSSLPVTCFNFYVKSKVAEKIELSIGLSWPNLLGWRLPHAATEVRQNFQWPSLQYAGNSGELGEVTHSQCHIIQSKVTAVKHQDDMLGNIVLSLEGKSNWNLSYKPCFRAEQINTGEKDPEQKYTIANMESIFRTKGKLNNDNTSWQAHWHEPIASALAADTILTSGQEKQLLFTITMDMPVTSFGAGRKWYKAYTEKFGATFEKSLQMAKYAIDANAQWIRDIDSWHRQEMENKGYLPEKVKGAQINELYFIVAGGSVWVTSPVEGHVEKIPKLKEKWHFGILEGFDTGYYYYNTLDLWVYAFAALSKHWPRLAENVFSDYLASALVADRRKHMVYRTATLEENLVYGKLPHDMGSAPEDPWVQLNGYVHRDDPNLWKDHNPAFIIAFYLHKQLMGSKVTKEEYDILVEIANFTANQDKEELGIPKHTDFGDSTWDNLDMKGLSTYAGGLCIGAWAVMAQLAEVFDKEKAQYYSEKLAKAQKTLQTLWNGEYFKTNDLGKYKNASMTDSLLGIFMAKKAGLGDLIPVEQAISHLKSIYENNLMAYARGKFGPLLVAEPGRQHYDRDGGEELQVNEVLVGSAWIFTAMLYEYGLTDQAHYLAENLRNMIYKGSGLQFRTPAAWDNHGNYRAPLNMRPLSIWLL
ncbi:MAG: GH116 family glycosyl hydrolase [Bacillota bacterium]